MNKIQKVITSLRGTYKNIAPIDNPSNIFRLCDEAEAELITFRAAFDDLVKIIEMQLQDKAALVAESEQLREALQEIMIGFIGSKEMRQIAKAALQGAAETKGA